MMVVNYVLDYIESIPNVINNYLRRPYKTVPYDGDEVYFKANEESELKVC